MRCLQIEYEKLNKSFIEIENIFLDFNESFKLKVMLICEEVITNQIRHADFGDKTPDITVCFDIKSKDDVTIFFKDNAKEFNPLKKEDPNITKSLEETRLGGLGIFLVKKYSKNIGFNYKNGYNVLEVEL